MAVYVTSTVLFAALCALTGTNAQARLARMKLSQDADPVVRAAARVWRPIRWMTTPTMRRRRRDAEAVIREDSARWARYERLTTELRAWNALETSVALALSVTVVGLLDALFR